MFLYILKRLIQMIPLVIGITFVSFIIIQLAPGSYIDQLKMNPQISAETLKELEKSYGLDQPLLVQYFKWLMNALTFDLGYSFSFHVPVTQLIQERVWNNYK